EHGVEIEADCIGHLAAEHTAKPGTELLANHRAEGTTNGRSKETADNRTDLTTHDISSLREWKPGGSRARSKFAHSRGRAKLVRTPPRDFPDHVGRDAPTYCPHVHRPRRRLPAHAPPGDARAQ